jgi:hypothetical protein
MENLRTEAIDAQIKRANELKQQIMELIEAGSIDESFEYLADLKKVIELSTEGYNFVLDERSSGKTDRMKGMLSGPLFTSATYPIPLSKKGKQMVPVVQLDLKDATNISGLSLGDGLLQVWFDDIDTYEDVTRVIPREEVNLSNLTPFEFNKEGHWILSDEWPFLKDGSSLQILGYESAGIAAINTSFLSIYINGDTEDAFSEELIGLLEKFDDVATNSSDLFSGFYGIQYNAEDFAPSRRCLIAIHDWSSLGKAQIFYEFNEKGKPSFNFAHAR